MNLNSASHKIKVKPGKDESWLDFIKLDEIQRFCLFCVFTFGRGLRFQDDFVSNQQYE
jgi:hypothetical protein